MGARAFRFSPAAEAELTAAASWYEERRSGLGGESVATIRNKIGDVLKVPERWPLSAGVHRALLAKFS